MRSPDGAKHAERGVEAVSFNLYVELTGRLVITLILCGAIGVQREVSGKAAGVRTHILVGVGSALLTVVSAYAFPGWPQVNGRDPTRVAAQIVSGIGFIGGGMILKEGLTVRGLTTAASLWAVAGVGMAAGSGLVPLACIATVLLLITLSVIGRLEDLLPQRKRAHWILSFTLTDLGKLQDIRRDLKDRCPSIRLVGLETAGDGEGTRVTVELVSGPRFDVVTASKTLAEAGAVQPHWKADSYGEELS
ncbi:MAG TPA: MgtC/SapB family protein [Chloroflexota bacterium]|nr:MgtC/SapB family protein [Chloroflexota bacterium]